MQNKSLQATHESVYSEANEVLKSFVSRSSNPNPLTASIVKFDPNQLRKVDHPPQSSIRRLQNDNGVAVSRSQTFQNTRDSLVNNGRHVDNGANKSAVIDYQNNQLSENNNIRRNRSSRSDDLSTARSIVTPKKDGDNHFNDKDSRTYGFASVLAELKSRDTRKSTAIFSSFTPWRKSKVNKSDSKSRDSSLEDVLDGELRSSKSSKKSNSFERQSAFSILTPSPKKVTPNHTLHNNENYHDTMTSVLNRVDKSDTKISSQRKKLKKSSSFFKILGIKRFTKENLILKPIFSNEQVNSYEEGQIETQSLPDDKVIADFRDVILSETQRRSSEGVLSEMPIDQPSIQLDEVDKEKCSIVAACLDRLAEGLVNPKALKKKELEELLSRMNRKSGEGDTRSLCTLSQSVNVSMETIAISSKPVTTTDYPHILNTAFPWDNSFKTTRKRSETQPTVETKHFHAIHSSKTSSNFYENLRIRHKSDNGNKESLAGFAGSQPNLGDSDKTSPLLRLPLTHKMRSKGKLYKQDVENFDNCINSLSEGEISYDAFYSTMKHISGNYGSKWREITLLYYLTRKLIRKELSEIERENQPISSTVESPPISAGLHIWALAPLAYPEDLSPPAVDPVEKIKLWEEYCMRYFTEHLADWVSQQGGFAAILEIATDSELD